MYREVIKDPEIGELELARLAEIYRELPIAEAEVYGYVEAQVINRVANDWN